MQAQALGARRPQARPLDTPTHAPQNSARAWTGEWHIMPPAQGRITCQSDQLTCEHRLAAVAAAAEPARAAGKHQSVAWPLEARNADFRWSVCCDDRQTRQKKRLCNSAATGRSDRLPSALAKGRLPTYIYVAARVFQSCRLCRGPLASAFASRPQRCSLVARADVARVRRLS